MTFSKFMFQYGWILAVLVIMGVSYFMIYKKYGKEKMFEKMRQDALSLMLLAQKKYGDNNGQIKFQYVVDNFIANYLPETLKAIWSNEEIAEFLQKIYDTVKDYLKDGKIGNDTEVKTE